MLSSRKNVLTLLAVVMASVVAIGLVVAAVIGKISWPAAFDYLFKTLFSSVLAIIANIWGIATEDAAKKGNSSNANSDNN